MWFKVFAYLFFVLFTKNKFYYAKQIFFLFSNGLRQFDLGSNKSFCTWICIRLRNLECVFCKKLFWRRKNPLFYFTQVRLGFIQQNLNKDIFTKKKQFFAYKKNMKLELCQEPDLNWWHEDFQSSALPTELSRQYFHFEVLLCNLFNVEYLFLNVWSCIYCENKINKQKKKERIKYLKV